MLNLLALHLVVFFVMMGIRVSSPWASEQVTIRPISTAGAVIVGTETLEEILRKATASALQGIQRGEHIVLETRPISLDLELPADRPILKELIQYLGIPKKIPLTIAPIDVRFQLPRNKIKLSAVPTDTQTIRITAGWEVASIAAKTGISARINAGLFNEAFTITARPLKVGIKKNSPPLEISVTGDLGITAEGNTLRNLQLTTSLNEPMPKLFGMGIDIESIRVNNQPFFFEARLDNNQIIACDETCIKREIASFIPKIEEKIYSTLRQTLAENFKKISDPVVSSQPFSLKWNALEQLKKSGKTDPGIEDLLRDIEIQFALSNAQYRTQTRNISAFLGAAVTLDSREISPPAAHTIIPVKEPPLGFNQASFFLSESWIQSVLHAPAVQKRVTQYVLNLIKTPGIHFQNSGIKIYFNSSQQRVDIVAPVSINLIALGRSQSSFRDRLVAITAGKIEKIIGAGREIFFPIQISLSLTSTENQEIRLNLTAHPLSFPVQSVYPQINNLQNMTQVVRKNFIDTLNSMLNENVNREFRISLKDLPSPGQKDSWIKVNRISFTPQRSLRIDTRIDIQFGDSLL